MNFTKLSILDIPESNVAATFRYVFVTTILSLYSVSIDNNTCKNICN